jgi:7-cyano-7-deazaguanine reductase
MNVEQSELGKKSAYITQYDPSLLFPIARQINRQKIGITGALPFMGLDIWNHYEVSWLDKKGKPIVALAEIIYACDSVNIIESKSMKLYFNSFNNTHIEDVQELQRTIQNDIETRIESPVEIRITPVRSFQNETLYNSFKGICIDDLDIECSVYKHDASLLQAEDTTTSEILYSDILKSNCLVTDQPDWGSVQITYQGPKINRESLLRYIVSYRNCNEFSETCIERIFMDIMQYCKPTELTVYGRFTRRGGLDINPIRSTHTIDAQELNLRFCRQ